MIDCGVSAVQIELFGSRTIRCEVDSPKEDTGDGAIVFGEALRHALRDDSKLLLFISDALIDMYQMDGFEGAVPGKSVFSGSANSRIADLKSLVEKWHNE